MRKYLLPLLVLLLAACAGGQTTPSASTTTSTSNSSSVHDAILAQSGAGLQYVFHGCNVYSPGDWLTANLAGGPVNSYVPSSIDPNSSTIMNYLQSTYGNIAWYSPARQRENLATNSTPAYPVGNGTEKNDPNNDDPNLTVPWDSSFVTERGNTSCTGGDCHTNELNTSGSPNNCVDYENYTSSIGNLVVGGKFQGGSGYVHNLGQSFNSQDSVGIGNISYANIPMMATTAWGEDLSYQQASCQPNCYIPHILGFEMPINGGSQSGIVAPARQQSRGCSIYCTHTLKAGARMILRSDFTCPSPGTYPQANLICNTLKTEGMIFDDTESSGCAVNQYGVRGSCLWGLRFGASVGGSNPWNGNGCCPGSEIRDLNVLLWPAGAYYMHISDFQLIVGGGQ